MAKEIISKKKHQVNAILWHNSIICVHILQSIHKMNKSPVGQFDAHLCGFFCAAAVPINDNKQDLFPGLRMIQNQELKYK